MNSLALRIHAMRMLNRDFRPGGHVRNCLAWGRLCRSPCAAGRFDCRCWWFLHAIADVDLCDRGLGDADHAAFVLGLEGDKRPAGAQRTP